MSLLKSLNKLDYPENELELTLVGGAGNETEFNLIKELAGKSKYKVSFTGRLTLNEVAIRYKNSDVFILPSFFDAIPLVVIEALACGMKVVMTNLSGVPEFFENNVPEANIRYVKLPTLRNMDEPVKEELPVFEDELAEKIRESIEDNSEVDTDCVKSLSWENILKKVLD